ncbi:MAG TPA: Phenylacetic acid catabolic protein [Herpetosiphonaceae bacterium]
MQTHDTPAAAAASAPAAALARLAPILRSLTDNKQQLGFRYAQWCTGAPTLEAATAATAMAQAELGHSRALLPVLDELAEFLPADALGDERTVIAFAALDRPFASWAEFVAANVALDGAMTALIESALATPFAPFQTRTRKMVDEERYHAVHGMGWVQKLARLSPESAAELGAALERCWPEALAWFGPDGGDIDQLRADGLLADSAAELRAKLAGRCAAAFAQLGLSAEAAPDWARWDAATRRLGAA